MNPNDVPDYVVSVLRHRVAALEAAISAHRKQVCTGNMIGSYKTAHAANHDLWFVLDGDRGEG